MSNSTGLWYTGQPLNHCFEWMEFVCTRKQTHWKTRAGAVSTHSLWMCLLSAQSFWVNNFDLRKTILSFLRSVVCMWVKGKRKKEKVITRMSCLCLWYISRETFSHFKNSPAISEIIGQFLVLSRLRIKSIFLSFFFFFHVQPSCQSSHSHSLLTMCQHFDASNNNNNTTRCEWLRSHFALAPYNMHYKGIQYSVQCNLLCRAWVTVLTLEGSLVIMLNSIIKVKCISHY